MRTCVEHEYAAGTRPAAGVRVWRNWTGRVSRSTNGWPTGLARPVCSPRPRTTAVHGSAVDHCRPLRDGPADGPVGHHRLRADDQRPPLAHGPALKPCGPAAGLHGRLRALRRRRSPLGAGDERLRPTRATGPDGRRGRHDPSDCHGHRHLGVSGLRAWQGPGASDERGRLRGHGRTGAWRDDREPGGLAWRLRCHGHSGHCRDGGRLLPAAAGRAQGATGLARPCDPPLPCAARQASWANPATPRGTRSDAGYRPL